LPALFRLDHQLRPQPELATAVPSDSDITLDPFTVRVRLRDATWSDGRPITSADVRFSFDKLRQGPTRWRYRYLREVGTPSPDVVTLVFDRPVRRWWSLFSIDDMVLPAHAYSSDWSRGPTVSGGPFVFDGWTRGLRIRLVRNPRFERVVPLAGIDVLFVPSDETRLQLLRRGELDALFSEGDSNMGRRAEAYGSPPVDGPLRGQAGTSSASGPTWWELDLDPAAMRLPIARAVAEVTSPDLVAEILEDSARPMNGIPPDFTRAERASAEPWRGRGSIEVARKVLDDGGIPPGSRRAEFQLAYARGGSGSAIATFIHFRLRELGIVAELVGVEPDTFARTFVAGRDAPALIRLRRGADAPDAGAYSATDLEPGAAAIDDQVVAAETKIGGSRDTELVVGLHAESWADAQRGLVEASTVAPLAFVRSFVVGGAGLSGPQPTGAANGPLWNAGDWSLDR
jgi:ABC-type transport system substrate-binding protein